MRANGKKARETLQELKRGCPDTNHPMNLAIGTLPGISLLLILTFTVLFSLRCRKPIISSVLSENTSFVALLSLCSPRSPSFGASRVALPPLACKTYLDRTNILCFAHVHFICACLPDHMLAHQYTTEYVSHASLLCIKLKHDMTDIIDGFSAQTRRVGKLVRNLLKQMLKNKWFKRTNARRKGFFKFCASLS